MKSLLNRRTFLQFTFLTSTGFLCFFQGLHAKKSQSSNAPQPSSWQAEIARLTGGVEPTQARVSLKLPDMASHQNRIPFTVSVDMPLSNDNYISTIDIFASKKSPAHMARFHLSALSGKAEVSSTAFLDSSQDIIALVQTHQKEFFVGRRQVQLALSREF